MLTGARMLLGLVAVTGALIPMTRAIRLWLRSGVIEARYFTLMGWGMALTGAGTTFIHVEWYSGRALWIIAVGTAVFTSVVIGLGVLLNPIQQARLVRRGKPPMPSFVDRKSTTALGGIGLYLILLSAIDGMYGVFSGQVG